MRWISGFGLALLAVVPVQTFAKNAPPANNDAVATGPAPAWVHFAEPMAVPENARGPMFVRSNDVEIHLDNRGEWLFVGSRVKLLDPSALQLGNMAFAWNPAAGTPVVHTIRIYRDGIVRDVLAEAKFDVLRRENQLEAATLDGVLTAALRIPDLRVGDELEIAYTLPIHDPTLRTNNYGFMFLGAVPPPGRMALRLSWEPGQEPVIQPTNDVAPSLKREAQAVSVIFDMPAVQNPPKDAPPRYSWQRVIAYSDFPDWSALSSRIAPLFEKASALSAKSAVRSEAQAIAAAHSDPFERAAAALKLVQQQVRYVYVGLNGGNLTPASAEETWQRRYGDCKGKTVLLLALLGELGIEAEAVLVSSNGADDGIDARLPNPGYFDHVLVRARIGGKTYWLDGTLPPVAGPSEDPVLPLRWVLPLSKAGSGLVRIAWKPEVRPGTILLVDLDARAGFAAPAKKHWVTITRGLDGLKEYALYSSVTDAQLEAKVRQEFEGSEEWSTVEKVSWHYDSVQHASVLDIAGTGTADWDKERTGSYSLALPGGGFSPPRKRQRTGSQGSGVPYAIDPEFSCTVTSIRLPAATAEKDWTFNTNFNRELFGQSFYRKFERRGGTIRMLRSNRTLHNEIDEATAAKDNALIAGFDNSKGLITYVPNSYDRVRPVQPVPAVDEIDWVANPDACLAPPLAGK